jgi:hypothetical protein
MAQQKLILDGQLEQLLANGRASAASEGGIDHEPVVKLFTPDGAATWLLSELDADGDTAFGLCDLGLGYPELGYVSLNEIRSVRGKLGLPVERDAHFKAKKKLSEYASESSDRGYIRT